MENYFQRTEVSNSDLTWLKKFFMPGEQWYDLEKAYAMGSLIDAMITEPERVDHFKLRLEHDPFPFSAEDFERCREMRKSFYKDPFCQQMVKQCVFQHVVIKPEFDISFDGFKFQLPARCKWDLFCPSIDLGGDIKSTTATTQKQCEEVVRYFDYDRSRAWYMDLAGRSNDILIFISKVNYKVFKIPVKRDSEIYRDGKAKYQELAFRWWTLFGGVKQVA